MDIIINKDAVIKHENVTLRSDEDKALISRAKEYIMGYYGIGEPEAHRMLQRKSMETSSRMIDIARSVLFTAGR